MTVSKGNKKVFSGDFLGSKWDTHSISFYLTGWTKYLRRCCSVIQAVTYCSIKSNSPYFSVACHQNFLSSAVEFVINTQATFSTLDRDTEAALQQHRGCISAPWTATQSVFVSLSVLQPHIQDLVQTLMSGRLWASSLPSTSLMKPFGLDMRTPS